MSEQEQPPYVEFQTKAVENRNASIAAGHYVGEDLDFAIVTARGSRDRVEHEISAWFSKIDADVRALRIPPTWAAQWKEAYKLWKAGQTTPESGTSIKEWPVVSPAQLQGLLSLHITTVEALAEANEETVGRLGMGGRALKQKAVDWIKASNSGGKLVEETNALRIKLAQVEQERDQLQQKVNQYESERRSEEGKSGRASGDAAGAGRVHQQAAG